VLLATDYEGAENPLGVRRAQMQLATFFLARGEEAPGAAHRGRSRDRETRSLD
jgi:hypothetical protein